MKKTIIFLMALYLAAPFTACGSEENSSSVSKVSVSISEKNTMPADEFSNSKETDYNIETEESESSAEEAFSEPNAETKSTSGILVAYFTYAENADLSDSSDASASASIQPWNGRLTGNTGVVADMIAQRTGGELFSIQTVKIYPSDYDGTIDEGQEEKNNDEHPELSTHIENLDEYDTIFVGFPNWWYGMPMAMYSFFEEYDFSGRPLFRFVPAAEADFLTH